MRSKKKKGKVRVSRSRYVLLLIILYFKNNWIRLVIFFGFLNSSLFHYVRILQYRSVEEIIEHRDFITSNFLVSVVCFLVSLNVLIFYGKTWKTRMIFAILQVTYFSIIFFMDQGSESDGTNMDYGYWISRLYILFLVVLEVIFLFFVFIYKFVRFLSKLGSRKIKFSLVATFTLLFFVFLYYLVLYQQRDLHFRTGINNVVDKVEESDCKINNGVFLFLNYIPKMCVHYFVNRWRCKKPNESFVTHIEDIDPTHTKITYTCPSLSSSKSSFFSPKEKQSSLLEEDNAKIRLIPNIHNYTISELSRKPWMILESFLQESMLKTHMQTIPLESGGGEHSFSYDSELYETVILECKSTKSSKVIVRPRKSRILLRNQYVYNNNNHNNKKKKERRNFDKSVGEEHYNILFLVFDSESRKRFEFDMPRSVRTLEKLSQSGKFNMYQFFKHNSVGINTLPVYQALFTGEQHNVRKKRSEDTHAPPPIWELAKEKSFVTVHTEDYCRNAYTQECGSYQNNRDTKIPYLDFLHVEPFCQEEYQWSHMPFTPKEGLFKLGRRCLFGKDSHEYLWSYILKMYDLFDSNPKFMTSWYTGAHEVSMQGIQWSDHHFSDFLMELDDRSAFDNTIVFIMGDHGNNIGVMVDMFQHGKVERSLPLLTMLLPKNNIHNNNKVFYDPDIMKINQYRFVTAFDLYYTMMKYLDPDFKDKNLENRRNCKNIFQEEIPREKDCQSSGISEKLCSCKADI